MSQSSSRRVAARREHVLTLDSSRGPLSSGRGANVWEYKELYVGGRWVAPATSRRIELVSPHSEEPLGSVPEASEQDVDRAVEAARRAFDTGPWPRTDPAERLAAVRRFAEAYAARQDE